MDHVCARRDRIVSFGSKDVCSFARFEAGDWPLRMREPNFLRIRLKPETDGQPRPFGLVSSMGNSFVDDDFMVRVDVARSSGKARVRKGD